MELPEEENTPEKRVDRIFAMMDKVSVSLAEDQSHCSQDKAFKKWNVLIVLIKQWLLFLVFY